MHYWLIPYGFFIVIIPYYCFTTAWIDPGILPRNTNPIQSVKADNPDEYDENGNVIAKLVHHHLNEDFIIGKQILIDGQSIFLKYCHTCQIFRPPRASHCHYCDNCVEEYDHHCPWLSNCIGRRNYRNFLLFVLSVGLASAYNTVFMLALMSRIKSKSGVTSTYFEFLSQMTSSFDAMFALFTLSTGLTLLGLFGYHLMLISMDLTTAEHVKKSKHRKFEKGTCLSNFYRIFFHPVPDAQIPWEQYTHRGGRNPLEVNNNL